MISSVVHRPQREQSATDTISRADEKKSEVSNKQNYPVLLSENCSHYGSFYIDEDARNFREISLVRKLQSIINTSLRWLRPCVTVRINLCNLLDRAELLSLPAAHAEVLANRLLLKSHEPDPSTKEVAWLRICPQGNRLMYEFIDPAAHDLVNSYHVFGRIIGYTRHEGMLYQLSAPSFSGKKAMLLIWNFMAMARMNNVL